MAAKSMKRGLRGTVTAVLGCLCLLVAGCEPGPPQPFPPLPAPGPGIPGGSIPAASVHFTAQGDIGVKKTSKQVLDTIADLGPQFNLALGDFAYRAGIEDRFCDMVKGKLGADFPYELLTGNHESDHSEGDIAKSVQCLPNHLPGLRGTTEHSGTWMSPRQTPWCGS